MTAVLVVGVYGAPPGFVVQPLLHSNDAQLGALQRVVGSVLSPTGGYVLVVAAAPAAKHQWKEGADEQYDDGTEESQHWKEEDETENEAKSQEEDYENLYDVDVKKLEKSYEESSTESQASKESNYYTEKNEDESENYAEPEKDESEPDYGSGEKEDVEENSTKETYNKKEASISESESREGKSAGGGSNEGDSESGNYYDKFVSYQKENEENHNAVHLEGNASIDKAHNKEDKSINPTKIDQLKPIHILEEIVVGSVNKSKMEDSQSQETKNTEASQNESDTKDSSAVMKLNPSLKETEEVQLAPVVYHVSPKLLQIAPV